MIRFVISSLFLCLLFSCKKDKLKGDNAILIGEWTWTQSDHVYGYCNDLILSETITPSSSDQNFSIEIMKKGIIKYYKDGVYLEKDRIVFSEFSGGSCDFVLDGHFFGINLNNDTELTGAFNGCVNSDSIILAFGFPYDNIEEGCESYVSYFVRQ
jgi:hypothetical protein